jgi:nitroreductase
MLEVLRLIQERQSVRALFDSGRPVANKDLMQILEAGRWAPTPHNMQNFEIIVVDDKKLLKFLGSIKYPISNSFIEENYQNLSFSEEELLSKKVGLLGTFFPLALRTPGVKLDEATYEEVRSLWGRTIETSPVLGVVAYDPKKRAPDSEGDFLGIIGLGCVLENMWLMAHSLGISFQVTSILNRDPAEKEVKRVLNIPECLKIAFGFRLGYALLTPTKYLRVRREVEDFTHHNQFGNKSLDSPKQ